MAPPSKLIAPAHGRGVTRLCFSRDGQSIFTAGQDSMVRIYQPSQEVDEEPPIMELHTDPIYGLDANDTYLTTASGDAAVRLFQIPDPGSENGPMSLSGIVTRAAGVPARCVAWTTDGNRLAIGSDDMVVKIVIPKEENKTLILKEHTRPVRAVSWSPDGVYLTTSGCDGKVIVWDTSRGGDSPLLVKVIDGILGLSDPDDIISSTATWHPSGKYFVIPSKSHEICIVNVDSWARAGVFDGDGEGHDSVIAELAWSPNGKYLASSGSDGKIIIWSPDKKTIIASHLPKSKPAAITGLKFSPVSNLLAWTDADGYIGRWGDVIPSGYPHPAELFGKSAAVATTSNRTTSGSGDVAADAVGEKKSDGLVDGEADEDMGMYDDDNWIIDDEDNGASGYVAPRGGAGTRDTERLEDAEFDGRELVNITKAQPAFQPGSTSIWRGKKRYLAFNMVGSIDVTDQDTHYIINVDFHDTSIHRNYHFQDHLKFTMAYLGQRGAIYACPSSGSHPSVITYKPFDTWSSTAEWTFNLPTGEDAVAVSAGGGSVVVATSRGYIRFFTDSGVQRYIWRMSEDVVSICMSEHSVMIAHREGGTSLDGCQNLRFSLMDTREYEITQSGRLPLAKKSALIWFGFSDEGSPLMYDTQGVMSTLDRYLRPTQGRWIPLLDTNTLARREGKDESYWPVGIQDNKFMCVILKGRETSPFFPRPLISDLEINMPLLGMDSAQGQFEEKHLRQSIHATALRDAQNYGNEDYESDIRRLEISMDKDLLQLIQTACKADKLTRALDAARLLHGDKSLDSAGKIADFYQLPGLKEKIISLRGEKADKRRDDEIAARSRHWSRYQMESNEYTSNLTSKPKQFEQFAPRPAGGRRTFAVATPTPPPGLPAIPTVSVSSRLAQEDFSVREESFIPESPPRNYDADDSMEVDNDDSQATEVGDVSMESNPKRKRDIIAEEFAPMPLKKRLSGDLPGALAPKAPFNPFAKKAAPASSGSPNPFAKPVAPKAPLTKSTSFFDRVDEHDKSSKAKSKSKDKGLKDSSMGPRQTTLFGLPPPVGKEKPAKDKSTKPRGRPKKSSQGEDESQSAEREIANDDAIIEIDEEDDEDEVPAVNRSPSTSSTKENHPPADERSFSSAASKLARFKMKTTLTAKDENPVREVASAPEDNEEESALMQEVLEEAAKEAEESPVEADDIDITPFKGAALTIDEEDEDATTTDNIDSLENGVVVDIEETQID